MPARTDFELSLQSQQKSVNQIWLRFDSQTDSGKEEGLFSQTKVCGALAEAS